ncbi:MAG: NAD-dependent succinate-semialdehyde dehydrogenase [Parvibaculales bacterium]
MAKSTLTLQAPDLLRQQAYINGNWCDADSDETLAVTNPATGAEIAHVPNMGVVETEKAIAAAQAAQPAWAALTGKERATILRRWHDLILAHHDDLALLMTSEQGKPLAEAQGEIAYAASYVEWFAEEAKRVYGTLIPSHRTDAEIMVMKQPVGVVAAITPWNFPAAMITRKVAPALAVGCSIIVKPASQTPLTALALNDLAEQAGVPAGVFSTVTGKASEIGGALTASPIVRKLSFTGSTEIGRVLLAQSAETVKKLSMELGGNAPFIVFDDADIDAAVEGAMLSKFRNSGQTCVCANRIYVQASVYDAFVEKLQAAMAQLVVGPGDAAGVTQGPLIDEAALLKVETHIEDALAKGARLMAGGARHELGGSFFQPTLLADVTQNMKIAHEETFGPIAPVFKFDTEQEVIAMANDSEFGLAAYFYARDMARIMRVAKHIESGMVGINTGLISSEVAPFGGIKQSGMGREGSFMGLDDYVEAKYVLLAGLDDGG